MSNGSEPGTLLNLELQRNIQHNPQFPGAFCLVAEMDELPTVVLQKVNAMLELRLVSLRIQKKVSQPEEENRT